MKARRVCVAFMTILGCALCAGLHAADYAIVFKGLAITPGERIVGFDLHVAPAYVSSMRKLPLGWRVAVDNDASWHARVQGSYEVGVAALEPAALDGLLQVTADEAQGPLHVTGEVVTTRDFRHEHRIELRPADVVLQRLAH